MSQPDQSERTQLARGLIATIRRRVAQGEHISVLYDALFRATVDQRVAGSDSEAAVKLLTVAPFPDVSLVGHLAELPPEILRVALRIVERETKREARHRHSRAPSDRPLPPRQDDPSGSIERADEAAAMARAIARLPALEQEIVRASCLQDETLQEIAGRLGMPTSTVHRHLRKGLDLLRRALSE